MKKATTNDQTTDDPKTTIGISIRSSLVELIRERAKGEDRNFSSMCAKLLQIGLANTATTGN